jgi:Family of unknown function (DUF6311)
MSEGGATKPKPMGFDRAQQIAIPVLLGVVAFFVVTGGRVLDPRNILWLSKEDDPATYFLGWHFFRNAAWGFPLGVSPRYGAELASSLMFVDNVPMFAFAFKAIQRFLPDTFQYFGFWILCCFVLQTWFAWLLVGLLTRAPFLRACGALFFVFAPPFLLRLFGHYSMLGQWLVLAALYICLGRRQLARGPAWPVLAFTVSVAAHAYMTAMVLGLWLTDWLRRVLFEGRTRAELLQLFIVPGLALLGFWQAGLFVVGRGITRFGFGIYRMNLTALVDASGWSYLLPDIPEGKGDYEGFNFLGLGGLLLVLLAAPALKGALPMLRAKRQYWPLLGLCVAFTLFAISNRIGFANRTFVIPLSQVWIDRANVLRCCGRMFWPVFYVLLWLLIRSLFRRYPPRTAGIILFVLVAIQAVDTSAGWRPIRRDLMLAGPAWDSPLKARFWSQVPANYQVIRLVPPRNHASNYTVFAYFAAMHGMATDSVYFARIDAEKLQQAKREALLAVDEGKYAAGTLYILDRRYEKAARRSANPELDWLGRVDGFSVLAPHWKCRAECASAAGSTLEDCSTNCPKK